MRGAVGSGAAPCADSDTGSAASARLKPNAIIAWCSFIRTRPPSQSQARIRIVLFPFERVAVVIQ